MHRDTLLFGIDGCSHSLTPSQSPTHFFQKVSSLATTTYWGVVVDYSHIAIVSAAQYKI
jgi:hypothetical protein